MRWRLRRFFYTLLVLVVIPGIGTTVNNAQRWLFGFQPSEIAKLTVIICFSQPLPGDRHGAGGNAGEKRHVGLDQ